MRRKHHSLQVSRLLLAAACLWVVLGAPVFPSEWQALPGQMLMALRQLPVRLPVMFRPWLLLPLPFE